MSEPLSEPIQNQAPALKGPGMGPELQIANLPQTVPGMRPEERIKADAAAATKPAPVLAPGEPARTDPNADPDLVENDTIMRSLFFHNIFKPEDYPNILAAPEDPELTLQFLARQREHMAGFAHYMRCQTRLLAVNEANAWLLDQVRFIFEGVNQRYYRFELGGPLGGQPADAPALPGGVLGTQILTFDKGQDLDWNVGLGGDIFATRKLSLVVFLTPLDQYEGGDFELMASTYAPGRREPGLIAVFPSYVTSRFHPVTSGRLQVLVSWMHGPGPFA